MQSAKDSFYVALRDRLAALNPERTVSVEGITRPGIVVCENEPYLSAPKQPDAFYLSWGKVEVAPFSAGSSCLLMSCECDFTYGTQGCDADGYSRGRSLGQMDSELLSICAPRLTPMLDYSSSPAQSLGSNVFWSAPEWESVNDSTGQLERTARLSVYFFEESVQ